MEVIGMKLNIKRKTMDFLTELLKQVMTYVKAHLPEIIAFLLKLIPHEPSEAVNKAAAVLKKSPTSANFTNFVDVVVQDGADSGQVAATILNKAKVAVPKAAKRK